MNGWIAWLGFPITTWWLPGLLFAYTRGGSSAVERLTLASWVGPCTVTPLAFAWSYGTRSAMTPWTVLVAAAVVSVAAMAVGRRFRVTDPPPPRRVDSRLVALGLVVLSAVAAPTVVGFIGRVPSSLLAPCPHKSAAFLATDAEHPYAEVVNPRTLNRITHITPHDTEPAFGLRPVLTQQRPGSATAFACAWVFHGVSASLALTFAYVLLLATGVARLVSRSVEQPLALLALTSLLVVGLLSIAGYMVNENVLVLGLLTHAFDQLFDRRLPRWAERAAAAGLLLALATGTRPELLLLMPGVVALVAVRHDTRRGRLRYAAVVLALFGLAYLPWGVVTQALFGGPFENPATGNMTTRITVWGYEFLFHPLNAPFADQWLRPPDAPYPTAVEMPLQHLQRLGLLVCVCALVGLAQVRLRTAALLFAFGGPIYVILAAIVGLDHAKMSNALLAMAPVPWLVGRGASRLRQHPVLAGSFAVALLILPATTRSMTFAVDARPQYGEPHREGSLEEQQERLLALYVLPRVDATPTPVVPPWQRALMAEPPQRGPEHVADAVVVWQHCGALSTSIALRLHDAPYAPPTITNANTEPYQVDRFVWLSVAVPDAPETLRVSVSWDDAGAVVALDGAPGAGVRYARIGLRSRRAEGPRIRSVTVRGEAVALSEYRVAPDGPVRIAANHPWRMDAGPDGGRLRPLAPPPVGGTLATAPARDHRSQTHSD